MKAKWEIDELTQEKMLQNESLDFLAYNKFYKSIWTIALPIYFQMISTVVLSIINSLIVRWIDNGIWTAVINKTNFAYNWVIFLPSFSSIGVFITIGNMLGSGKKDEIHKVIFQGWVINLSIASIVIIGMLFSKNFIFSWVNLEEKYWNIASTIYYINLLILFLNSINVVNQRAEAALGKTKTLFLVLLSGSIVNTISVLSLVFVINPAIAVGISSLISTFVITMWISTINCRRINFKAIFKKNRECWNLEIFKTMLLIGIPAAIETLIFNFTAAFVTKYITLASIIYGGEDILFNTLNATQQITNFGLLMSSALGQVSAIFVSRLIGSGLYKWNQRVADRCWFLTLYFAMPFSIATIALCYPLLKIYNIPTDVIWSTGIYLFLIICFQDFGRTMNQVGLSCLRAVKYTIIPLIIAVITLAIFNIGFVVLLNKIININEVGLTSEQISTKAIQLLIGICSIQAIEEVVRGSSYWFIWKSNLWDRNRGKKKWEKLIYI